MTPTSKEAWHGQGQPDFEADACIGGVVEPVWSTDDRKQSRVGMVSLDSDPACAGTHLSRSLSWMPVAPSAQILA